MLVQTTNNTKAIKKVLTFQSTIGARLLLTAISKESLCDFQEARSSLYLSKINILASTAIHNVSNIAAIQLIDIA
jgi:hypothetical protein